MNTVVANSQDAPNKPNPQFIQSIQAGLRYWQQKTATLGPEQVHWLDQRRKNLHQAILFGLNQPETWEDTAQLLLQAFDFSEWRGYWSEWVPVFEQALANAPEKESVVYGRLQNRLGQLYHLDNRLSEAEEQHQATLTLAQRLGHDELLFITYQCFAELYQRQKDVNRTREHVELALALTQTQPALEAKAGFTHRILGHLEEYLGNWAEAIQQNQKAVELWRKHNNHIYLARTLNDLGNVYQKDKQYGRAQKAYKEAADILKMTLSFKDMARVYTNLAVLFYRQEKWQDAEKSLLQISPTDLKANHDTELFANWYNNLGNVYLKMAEWEKAEAQIAVAMQVWRDIDDKLNLANSVGTLGKVYGQTEQIERSLSCYEEAISLLREFPESEWGQKLLKEFTAEYEAVRAKG